MPASQTGRCRIWSKKRGSSSSVAILAAVLFAFGTVLQQKGTMATEDDDARFLLHILHRPVWLAGAALQATGWVVQAMALDRASLVVVQSITALSLVLALPLGVALTGQRIRGRELSGAILTMLGIVFFISAGQPQGGTTHPSASTWWTACLVTVGWWASSSWSVVTTPARPRP